MRKPSPLSPKRERPPARGAFFMPFFSRQVGTTKCAKCAMLKKTGGIWGARGQGRARAAIWGDLGRFEAKVGYGCHPGGLKGLDWNFWKILGDCARCYFSADLGHFLFPTICSLCNFALSPFSARFLKTPIPPQNPRNPQFYTMPLYICKTVYLQITFYILTLYTLIHFYIGIGRNWFFRFFRHPKTSICTPSGGQSWYYQPLKSVYLYISPLT